MQSVALPELLLDQYYQILEMEVEVAMGLVRKKDQAMLVDLVLLY